MVNVSISYRRRRFAGSILVGWGITEIHLGCQDCLPMVDSFLTPVMLRQCSFFNGLCYMILRILSNGRTIFTHLSPGQQLRKFHWNERKLLLEHLYGRRFGTSIWPTWRHIWKPWRADVTSYMKTLFTRKWLMHFRICKHQLRRSDISKTPRDHNLPLKFLVQQ